MSFILKEILPLTIKQKYYIKNSVCQRITNNIRIKLLKETTVCLLASPDMRDETEKKNGDKAAKVHLSNKRSILT